MKLTFIVNGTETIVEAKETDILKDVCELALEQVGYERPVFDFQAIFNDETLSFFDAINNQKESDRYGKRTSKDINLFETSVIFLSLKAGIGA